ncbi:MAG: hypothetical protein JW862_04695 [Anaerolineales bacterium]|nr:hypothetical protein [Anaerolineales bacterium]
MTTTPNASIARGKALPRAGVVHLLQTAIQVAEYRFARTLAERWLDSYPGDLQVDYLFAQALLHDELFSQALPVLKRICNTDPEYLDAQRALLYISNTAKYSTAGDAQACVLALETSDTADVNMPSWGHLLSYARLALQKEDHEQADTYIRHALQIDPPTPLVAVTHLELAREHYDWLAQRKLVEHYHERWPDCLQCTLLLADILMQAGEEERAVALLHQCAANDVTGQVAKRLWGETQPYASLWPKVLEINLDIPIPAAVSGALGWNQLPTGEIIAQAEPASTETETASAQAAKAAPTETTEPDAEEAPETTSPFEMEPETDFDIQTELQRIKEEDNRAALSGTDARFPVYVVLSTRQALVDKYGEENFATIDQTLEKIVERTKNWRRWNAMLCYVDDFDYTGKLGLSPVKASDPWSIKKLLQDIDDALRTRGEMIGALLIVGGPDIVPFHHLPNPVDDIDHDVPSDNPYATCDENYFVPSWPVGRIPDGAGSEPQLLLHNLEVILQQRGRQPSHTQKLMKWLERLLTFLHLKKQKHPSLGYTAEIWRRASHSVFRPIGEARALAISPPSEAAMLSHPAHLGYFNLHGLEDSGEWYGQRDPLETSDGPDYPVALRPQDVVNSGRAPQIVYSEACYGAHIIDKTPQNALALKFLQSGSLAMVGSTCTSYGSISMPLIAADLLGQAFWKLLLSGHPAGEALRRAKIHLAREMHRRQGYLDGEDQKTLISFLLYGDPLAQPQVDGHGPKNFFRDLRSTNVYTTVREPKSTPEEMQPVPDEIMQDVKKVVKSYLPGMNGALVKYARENIAPLNGVANTSSAKSKAAVEKSCRVVTLSKQIEQANHKHHQYARIKLNEQNKVVKLAVSR